MTVTLSPQTARLISEQVAAGRFVSADAAVDAAVAQLAASGDPALDGFRADVDVGLADADRGEFVEFTAEDVIAERRAAYARRRLGQGGG